MIGTIVGGALSIGSSIFGNRAKRKAAKKRARLIAQQKKENQQWYDRRYNEDATQRADAQRSLELMRQAMDDRNKRAEGSAVVSGASDESLAMQKDSANKALGATIGNIVVQGEARTDDIEQQYLARKEALDAGQLQTLRDTGRNTSDAITGAVSAAAGIANGLDGNGLFNGLFKKKDQTKS